MYLEDNLKHKAKALYLVVLTGVMIVVFTQAHGRAKLTSMAQTEKQICILGMLWT